jgi:hypothetical protein
VAPGEPSEGRRLPDAAEPPKTVEPPPAARQAPQPRGFDGDSIDRRTRIHTASVQGMILLNGDFVTEDEHARINEEQSRRKEAGQTAALGQVAVEMGFVTPEQLRFVMALGRRLNPKADEPKSLALFLLEHNVIRPSALNAALDRAEESGTSLEAVLVEMNLINSAALRTFVDIHARFASRS